MLQLIKMRKTVKHNMCKNHWTYFQKALRTNVYQKNRKDKIALTEIKLHKIKRKTNLRRVGSCYPQIENTTTTEHGTRYTELKLVVVWALDEHASRHVHWANSWVELSADRGGRGGRATSLSRLTSATLESPIPRPVRSSDWEITWRHFGGYK